MVQTQENLPSIAVFSPQSQVAGNEYLDRIRQYLFGREVFQPFVETFSDILSVWDFYVQQEQGISELKDCYECVQSLSRWMKDGEPCIVPENPSGTLVLPLLIAVQLVQYFYFLESRQIKHEDMSQYLSHGGIQGYCGGFLMATSISVAQNEEEVVKNTCTALRIAIGVGVYAHLEDDSKNGSATLVTRLKREDQAGELIDDFDGVYIASITDPKTVGIVGPEEKLDEVERIAKEKRLVTQKMQLKGKVHNPENVNVSEKLYQACLKDERWQFPSADRLRVPLRSNRTTDIITNESLTKEATSVLHIQSNWYNLIKNVANDLKATGSESHSLAFFGIGDCVPKSAFNRAGLKTSRIDLFAITKAELPSISSGVKLEPQVTTTTTKSDSPESQSHMKSEDIITNSEMNHTDNSIAITGVACRFSGANDFGKLWDILKSGESRATEISNDKFEVMNCYRGDFKTHYKPKSKLYSNFLDSINSFDHSFFRMSPRESTSTDPQQRLLLETAYQALDSSGHLFNHKRESGEKVGVFVGVTAVDYYEHTSAHDPTAYTATGTLRSFLSGKISHYFGFTGPSETFDTACSSSLVAVNRACRAIQSGECSIAIAGGVNLTTTPNMFFDLEKAGFLSKTGQCKPFDIDADGYCRGEGVALIVLKSLKQAMENNDPIFGVIDGIATNQSGLAPSITVPHSPAQTSLYRELLTQSNLTAEDISYIEAHGPGTQVGDPIEIASIREVFGQSTKESLIQIGSIKGNIGHTEATAGVAGMIKALLILKHRQIVPQASYKSLNPKIESLYKDGLEISTTLKSWSHPGRAILVNSYGAAGSNAATILTSSPYQEEPKPSTLNNQLPFLLSAASKRSLKLYANVLRNFLLNSHDDVDLTELALTLSDRKARHQYIWTKEIQNNKSEVINLLDAIDESQIEEPTSKPRKKVVLAVSGQNKRNIGLDKNWYDNCGSIRYYLDICNETLINEGFGEILSYLFLTEPVEDVVKLQFGTFAVQYAFAKSWIDAGVEVDAVIGHSFGELTALAVSGILSLESATRIIAGRASLMQKNWGPEPGQMVAITGMSEQEVRSLIESESHLSLEIACLNADSTHVLIGSRKNVSKLEEILRETSIKGVRRLDTTYGFHSIYTEPLLEELDRIASCEKFEKPNIQFEACTAERVDKLSADRISHHTRQPVHFSEAVKRLELDLGPSTWLEAGVDSPIISMVKKAVKNPDQHTFNNVGSISSLGKVFVSLWRQGIRSRCKPFLLPKDTNLKPLWIPPYQFDHTDHGLPYIDRVHEAVEAIKGEITTQAPTTVFPLLTLLASTKEEITFELHKSSSRFKTVVEGHKVVGHPLCPLSIYMEAVVLGLVTTLGEDSVRSIDMTNIKVDAPLTASPDGTLKMILHSTEKNDSFDFIFSNEKSNTRKVTHSKGHVSLSQSQTSNYLGQIQRLVEKSYRAMRDETVDTEILGHAKAYKLFTRIVEYCHLLKRVRRIKLAKSEAIAEITVANCDTERTHATAIKLCDAVSIDGILQVGGMLLNCGEHCSEQDIFVAVGVDSFMLAPSCRFVSGSEWSVYVNYDIHESVAQGDAFVFDENQKLIIAAQGIYFSKTKADRLQKSLGSTPKNDNVEKKPAISAITLEDEPTKPSEIGTPNHSIQDVVEVLIGLISSYVGLDSNKIPRDASMTELGLDSLAAIELAEELESKHSIDIAEEDIKSLNVNQLMTFMPVTSKSGRAKDDQPSHSIAPTESDNLNKKYHITEDGINTKSVDVRNSILEMISDFSGLKIADLEDTATIESVGLDSLSLVELSSDIETRFFVSLEDDIEKSSTLGSIITTVERHFSDKAGCRESQSVVDYAIEPHTHVQASSYEHNQISHVNQDSTNKIAQRKSICNGVNPATILSSCNHLLEEDIRDGTFHRYWDTAAPLEDKITILYIVEAFEKLGIDLTKPCPAKIERNSISCSEKQRPLVNRLWEILVDNQIITKEHNIYRRNTIALPQETISQLRDQLMNLYPAYEDEAFLLSHVGPELSDFLTGEKDPMSFIFQHHLANDRLVKFYSSSPLLSTMNQFLVQFMQRLTQSDYIEGPLSIIEVGAGTGATSKALLKSLPSDTTYHFTDISPNFVSKAKDYFENDKSIQCYTLDIEKEIKSAQKEVHDIIVATNVVHATSNIIRTLNNLGSQLKPGGILILSEATIQAAWYDIVFGLFDGWWSFKDGRKHPLKSGQEWIRDMNEAGFEHCAMSHGSSTESNTQRLIVGQKPVSKSLETESMNTTFVKNNKPVETVPYKNVDGHDILADIYYPRDNTNQKSRPIALMVHGGGNIMLSRKTIRPKQVQHLLELGFLPVSVDYRLCPEINIVEGAMTDVRDALKWVRLDLSSITERRGVSVNTNKIAVIGWSTGGHLAMTTCWTCKEINQEPPNVVIAFYAPTNFFSPCLERKRGTEYPDRLMPWKDIEKALSTHPISEYEPPPSHGKNKKVPVQGADFILSDDARSQILASLFKEGKGHSLQLHGVKPGWEAPPTQEELEKIDPLTQIKSGQYTTPTILLHGSKDEMLPLSMPEELCAELSKKDISNELIVAPNAKHTYDLFMSPGQVDWERYIAPAYRFAKHYTVDSQST